MSVLTSPNTLYYGDNLPIMRENLPDESVDLIYLDPPFKSDAAYNVLFKDPTGRESDSQIEAFDDTWHWTDVAEQAFHDVMRGENSDVSHMLRAMRDFLHENDMMAYLTMMTIRLLKLKKVLKPRGTLYLHCDPTASHYLKIMLDAVFGRGFHGNEIIWKRQNAKGLASLRFPRNHDTIFRYTKSENFQFTPLYTKHDPDYIKNFYKYKDEDGRVYSLDNLANPNKNRPNLTYEFMGMTRVWRWTKERMEKALADGLVVQLKPGTVPRLKRYLDEQEGTPIDDVWVDIPPVQPHSKEALGYPTQKPIALLERIIAASSKPGDLVLDPFCGCGTSVHAAEKMGRRWIGIDITHIAIKKIKERIIHAFPRAQFEVVGIPKDIGGARELATANKHQFQLWALAMIDAQTYKEGRKGADGGVDGYLFFAVSKTVTEKAIISVKGGENVSVTMVRDLIATIERERAKIGIMITLTPPTKPMITEAAAAGIYQTEFGIFQKIQILTVQDLFDGKKPHTPWRDDSMVPRAKREKTEFQKDLDL